VRARGLDVLRYARRRSLWRLMRSRDDPRCSRLMTSMRDTTSAQPVPDDLVDGLRAVTAADVRADPLWATAPIGVLSHVELNALNPVGAEAFTRAHGLPLVKWRLPSAPDDAAKMDSDVLRGLYDHEPSLYGYFVEGAPITLTETFHAKRHAVRGTPGLLNSLSSDGVILSWRARPSRSARCDPSTPRSTSWTQAFGCARTVLARLGADRFPAAGAHAAQAHLLRVPAHQLLAADHAGNLCSILFQCQHHRDEPISEQARIALPVCVAH
jgi:hypothetical protein